MPFPLHALILWLHLLAAMIWIGGLVFQVLVVFPTLAWATPVSYTHLTLPTIYSV